MRCARTAGIEATALTAFDTSRVRMGPATSWPSTRMPGLSGSVPTSMTGTVACAATAPASWTSVPRASSHQVSARYVAPVSRKRRPRARATPRAADDLPDPDGPSTAITRAGCLVTKVMLPAN